MPKPSPVPLVLANLLLAGSAHADGARGFTPASLVSIDVSVEGRDVPLYPAQDGSDRSYLEACEGARYAIRLTNRSGERLGAALSVDGLNVISGERPQGRGRPGDPGRMYILEPWDTTEVRGWRTSLRDVQRFVFVDERTSYAARTGQANGRMGWIELSVYRERYPRPARLWPLPMDGREDEARRPHSGAADADGRVESGRKSAESRPPAAAPLLPDVAARAYPGTGWGPRADDPAELVAFEPQPHPAQRVTLRYEYRQALLALGINLGGPPQRDRLWERERGERGFAQPPRR